MNKIGFAIQNTSAGVGLALACNKDSWINKVTDIRNCLKLFKGLDGMGNTVSFMSFDEKGCFLTIARYQSGRLGDNISGWIYIPNNILISGEQVEQAHDFVKGILSKSNLSVVKDQIEAFFSTEYPLKEVFSDYIPSSGEEYAVRFIGHYSLREILDKDRYQPYYSKYKAIFLLYKNGDVTVSNESGRKLYDLTQYSIEKTFILMPPSPEAVAALGDNVKILFENRAPFHKAFSLKADSEITLLASKGQFEPIRFSVKVDKETTYCDLSKISPEWRMKVTRDIFNVVDKDNNKVSQYDMTIGSQKLVGDAYAFIAENQLYNAQIIIRSSKYEDFSGRFDLTQYPIKVVLERKGMELNSTMILPNNKLATVIVRSKDINPKESPFKGYVINRDNELVEDEFYKWKQRLIGVLISIGLFALFALYSVFESSDYNPFRENKKEARASSSGDNNEDANKQGENSPSLKDLLEYLDKNKTWNKSELEKFGKGELFTDMNNFNLEHLASNYSDLLESQNFSYVKEAVIRCLNSKKNPQKGNHNPTWNKENDSLINIDNYVGWLNNLVVPQTVNERPNNASPESCIQIRDNSQNRQTQTKSSLQPRQTQGSGHQQKNVHGNKGDIFQ